MKWFWLWSVKIYRFIFSLFLLQVLYQSPTPMIKVETLRSGKGDPILDITSTHFGGRSFSTWISKTFAGAKINPYYLATQLEHSSDSASLFIQTPPTRLQDSDLEIQITSLRLFPGDFNCQHVDSDNDTNIRDDK